AGGQPAPLLEPIDAALHDVAPRVEGLVKGQRTPPLRRAPRPLIPSLRNQVRDLSRTEQPTAAWVAVALIGNDTVWSGPGPSPSVGGGDAKARAPGPLWRAVGASPG